MEFFSNEALTLFLLQYGSIALFILLVLGIIALPIPEETLMVFAGVLMHKGMLIIPLTVLAALAGSILGISLSYLIGRTGGHYLIQKYGPWIGIGDPQLQKAKDWFDHFGKWTLFIGYFIPGLRHFTGFSAGMTGVEYRHFALFAYSGALVWVSLFLSAGYFFSDFCVQCLSSLEFSAAGILILFVAFGALVLIVRKIFLVRIEK